MTFNCLNRKSSGMTLVEVLIAMAILVFISFMIYQATVETYSLRDSLTTDGDFYNGIRLSTMIMQRDISLIYSPTMMMPNPTPSANPVGNPVNPYQPQLPDDLGHTYTFWAAALDASGIRPSHFIGSENKLSFVSLSHIRVYKDTSESDFTKIIYELKKDTENKDNPGTQVLVKTENLNAFSNDEFKDPVMRTYQLLHGIKNLSYSYYMRDGNTWKILKSWDTDHEDTKNKFPDIIELKLEVLGPKKQVFEGKFKFRLEIPLNGINPKY